MTTLSPPKIRLWRVAEAISVIPYLLGFEPSESLVVLVIDDSRVVVTARVDLADALRFGVAELKSKIEANFGDAEYILAAYSDDHEAAIDALEFAARRFGKANIWDAVLVTKDRFFSVHCDDPKCCPAQGQPYPVLDPAVQAEVVGAGLTKLDSREALAEVVSPPVGNTLRRSRNLASRLAPKLCDVGDKRAYLQCLLQNDEPSFAELVELGLLVHDVSARNSALFMLDRTNCHRYGARWQRVVRSIPPEVSAPSLGLAAIAAWLTGDGALMMICYEQAIEIEPESMLLGLVAEIYEQAAPPSAWDRLNPIATW